MQTIANLPASSAYGMATSNDTTSVAEPSNKTSNDGPLVSPQPNPFHVAATSSSPPHAPSSAQTASADASSAALLSTHVSSAGGSDTHHPVLQYLQELPLPPSPPTPEAITSDWVHRELKAKYGLDVDPDHTYLVSLNYNTGGQPGTGPYPGQVVRKESLTDATMHNTRDTDTGSAGNTVVPYRSGGPSVQVTPNLPIKRPSGLLDLFSSHRHDERADYTYTYEGIYRGGDDSRYGAATQLPIDPKDFRATIWRADPIKVVNARLDTFWGDNEKNYSQQARLSFTAAAHTSIPRTTSATHQPGDLQPADLQLAARMVQQPPSTEITTGRLTIGGYVSTDVMYAQDKSGRILLYTPGCQPPLQGFDSVGELRGWLASDLKDPAKRDALQTHFKVYDQQDGTDNIFGKAGVHGILNGMAAYPDTYAPPTLLWHKGRWDPDSYIALAPQEGDTFEHLTQDVKARSYADAQTLVTSNRDVTERTVLKWTNIASTVLAAALVPLSMTRVGVSLLQKAVTAGDFANAGASIGIGVDQTHRNKPDGTASIVNGLMPLLLLGAFKSGEGAARKLAQGGVDTSSSLQQAGNTCTPPGSKPLFNPPARVNGRIGDAMEPQRAPKVASSESENVKDRISREYILPEHMEAIARASKIKKFAVSFRKAGALTLDKLAKGAAAKGHDILEKTIKESSIRAYYPNDHATVMQKIKAACIDGYVGHWEEGKGLVGIYLRGRYGLRHVEEVTEHGATHYIYPIELNRLTESLEPLTLLPQWERIPFTGDYDMHDMITFTGAGRPRTALTAEEENIINWLNEAISKVDKKRPYTAFTSSSKGHEADDCVIRHGPQVNYVNYSITREKELFYKNGINLAVAEPGEFPIAMVNKGHWSIINNVKELQDFYKSIGATLKETWKDNGFVKYHRRGYFRTNSLGEIGARTLPDVPRKNSRSSSRSSNRSTNTSGSDGNDVFD